MFKWVHEKTDGQRLYLYGTRPHTLSPLPEGQGRRRQGPIYAGIPCMESGSSTLSTGETDFPGTQGIPLVALQWFRAILTEIPFPELWIRVFGLGQSSDTSGRGGVIW